MKIAYLVLAHNNPRLLARTIERLSTRDVRFFIHVDRKADLCAFENIHRENVLFCEPRVRVYWGDFSQVEAILVLLRTAMADWDPGYFVLISGTDYPLRSGVYIQNFLEQNEGTEFLNLTEVPAPGKPLSRINNLRCPRRRPFLHLVTRILAKAGLVSRDYRKHLSGLDPYSGGTWWALSQVACTYVLEFVKANAQFVRFFENMFAADEAFFHTILGNSYLRPRIRRNLHYEDWSQQGPHPAMISREHLQFFHNSDGKAWVKDTFGEGEVLFARKFSEADPQLLQQIDDLTERSKPPKSVHA